MIKNHPNSVPLRKHVFLELNMVENAVSINEFHVYFKELRDVILTSQ